LTISEIPAGWQELGELIASGEMFEDQITELISEHGHAVSDCKEVCLEICEEFDMSPFELLVENYNDVFTLSHRQALNKTFGLHVNNDEMASWIPRSLAEIASGPSADLDLLKAAALHVESFIYSYRDENLSEEIKDILFRFARNSNCTEDVLSQTVRSFHDEVLVANPECSDGEFEACDFCQDLVQEAIAELK
jgi:hypothetical protein